MTTDVPIAVGNESRAFRQRILSIDGGGVRGIVPCVWLTHVERVLRRLGSPTVGAAFDLMAGNSTGAIIVAGLAAGKAPQEIAVLYEQASRAIFPQAPRRVLSRARRIATQGLSAPKFDGRALDRVLQLVFGERTLADLEPPVLIPAYDTIRRTPVFFRSDDPAHRALAVWEVCRASSAAPGYFPAHRMRVDGREMSLIDGGVFANNPVLCAIDAALARLGPGARTRDLALLSLGTGHGPYPIRIDQAQRWGAVQWAMPILDIVFDANTENYDRIARRLLGDGYLRLQVELAPGRQLLDDASDEQMRDLRQRALDHLLLPDIAAGLQRLLQRLVTARTNT